MLYLQILNIGKFTSLLFAGESFDRFLLHDASFETVFTTIVEGKKNAAFFSEEEREKELEEGYIRWSLIRPSAYKLLQGKRLPVSFKVILLTAPSATKSMVDKSGFSGCPVSSLSISAVYREEKLLLRTGVSYSGFSMDRSLEKYWDESVLKFLQDKEIEYAEPES